MRWIGRLRLFGMVAVSLVARPVGASWCDPPTVTPRRIPRNATLDLEEAEAARYADYAILSNDAYGPLHEQIPLPPDWSRADYQYDDPRHTGLELAVFERRTEGVLSEVAVAFRGTDEPRDWKTNLLPFFRKQMKPAEVNFQAIKARYTPAPVRIVTTGHSLGGGLALHISFHNPGVDAVVFDSSPVARPGFLPLKGATRVSIWQRGEALQAPRDSIRSRWPGTSWLEYDFIGGSPVERHNMTILAGSLVKLGAVKSERLAAFLSQVCGGAASPGRTH